MDKQKIKNYLEGKTNEEESKEIREWLKKGENENESRKLLGEIWTNSSVHLSGTKPDFGQMLDKVHHRINDHKPKRKIHTPDSGNNQMGFFEIFSKVAAVLIVPIFLVSLYFNFREAKVKTPDQVAISPVREIYTKPGTRTKIELADGTMVWLNDGTTFRYPEYFSGKNREVFVDGEAYFEVKSNPENPFIVTNALMKTIVTGTHFNINAYTEDHYFEATLLEGKIHLEKNDQKILMKPGEQVQFDAKQETIVQKNVDPENAAAWIDGKLIFNDEKVGIAVKKLGRWFNVEIILTDPDLADFKLTGTFQDEKLDQTLKLISLALPVNFEFKKEESKSKLQRTIYMKKI
ncbi:MAG: FecR domain-containing protein [Prolixibacteraceae bacterium]